MKPASTKLTTRINENDDDGGHISIQQQIEDS